MERLVWEWIAHDDEWRVIDCASDALISNIRNPVLGGAA